jgi:serine/threonine-protein kinase
MRQGQITTQDLTALVSLSHRYGLAVSQLSEQGEPRCHLQVFSRWGRLMGRFDLPVALEQVTPNPDFPGQFLALDENNPQIALLVHLYPWKVERLCLGVNARWLQPMPWGYVVADDEGQVLMINRFGEILGSFSVDQPVTAMASFGKAGLVLATWAETEGQLLTLNLRRFGLALD